MTSYKFNAVAPMEINIVANADAHHGVSFRVDAQVLYFRPALYP